ncbi:aspartate--tRNA ligase [Anoxybacillus kestanbolensis]|uniref:aspartate--tRNA ligase n=1 Tax=Anoxybacillus kestanbolensis TaxID=227476 RepID=UPI00208DCE96|nr:aspartate--tRNA ligase [Anoxybacillus kestanbolensis]MCL9970720.1 aspartate--tRNA ligase [Anoxybacillus kestanbolensis]
MKRTHNNGELTKEHIGEYVTLLGWVHNRRDLGGLIFLDLRDRYGITQIVVQEGSEVYNLAAKIRKEFVIKVEGKVVLREKPNKLHSTGEIEVVANSIQIINQSETPPLGINEENEVNIDTRLRYRYLDLRRPKMQRNLIFRHKVLQSIRGFLNQQDFLEIDTPILTKSTPEGARDFLVPSRLHENEYYALPQSPQLFKQLLMVSGFEKYYQIAKCFRDEDLRADRQPEFTQLDIETSFFSEDQILSLIEQLVVHVFKETLNIDIPVPFKRITYKDCINLYGTDKPDIRYGMEQFNISSILKNCQFTTFKEQVEKGGYIKCIVVNGGAESFTRKEIENLSELSRQYGAKGLAWLKYIDNDFIGPISKFLSIEEKNNLKSMLKLKNSDLVLIIADEFQTASVALGHIRTYLGEKLGLTSSKDFQFVWVVDWPLFEFDDEEKRYVAAHHPFTAPKEEDIEKLESDTASVMANAYDLVLNGYELGSGSLRIYSSDLQKRIFKVIGLSEEQAIEEFNFLLEALKFGAPPHGGIAIGLDRLLMLMLGEESIREVIPFPKNKNARCPLTLAPSRIKNYK